MLPNFSHFDVGFDTPVLRIVVRFAKAQLSVEDFNHYLENASLCETASAYIMAKKAQFALRNEVVNDFNYKNIMDLIKIKSVKASSDERASVFPILMAVLANIRKDVYATVYSEIFVDLGIFDIDGFYQYAKNKIEGVSNNNTNASSLIKYLLECLEEDESSLAIKKMPSKFTQNISHLEDLAAGLGVNLKEIIQESFKVDVRCGRHYATILNMFNHYHIKNQHVNENLVDDILSNGSKSQAADFLSYLTPKQIVERNGSVLYKLLRSGNQMETMSSVVPLLLRHVDPIACVKNRLHDVSAEERFNVCARLALFLDIEKQNELLRVLDESFKNSKYKSAIQCMVKINSFNGNILLQLHKDHKTRQKIVEEIDTSSSLVKKKKM